MTVIAMMKRIAGGIEIIGCVTMIRKAQNDVRGLLVLEDVVACRLRHQKDQL
jgi:hypothetical protein